MACATGVNLLSSLCHPCRNAAFSSSHGKMLQTRACLRRVALLACERRWSMAIQCASSVCAAPPNCSQRKSNNRSGSRSFDRLAGCICHKHYGKLRINREFQQADRAEFSGRRAAAAYGPGESVQTREQDQKIPRVTRRAMPASGRSSWRVLPAATPPQGS